MTREEREARTAEFESELRALLKKYGVTLTAEDHRVGYNSDFGCEYLSEDEYWPHWHEENE